MQIKSGQKVESFETQRIIKNGTILDILIIITCLENEFGVIDAIATTKKDITEIKNNLREKEAEEIKLKSLLPICAACKQIRDDQGYWHQIEQYIESHSDTKFSHGLCPKCEKKLYINQKSYKKNINNVTDYFFLLLQISILSNYIAEPILI